MNQPDALERKVGARRDRASGLQETLLRPNAGLDFQSVLREVVVGACALTGARQGGIAVLDGSGQIQDFVTHGLTLDESDVADVPEHPFGSRQLDPLPSLDDVANYITSVGGTERSPEPTSFLSTVICFQGSDVGNFYIANKEGGGVFTQADRRALEVFASQAGAAIIYARKHDRRGEVTIDLESLINATPIGVLVFDGRTALPIAINQEAKRMVSHLHSPEVSAEHLLKVMTVQLSNGLEIGLDRFPLAKVLAGRETVRAEEVTINVPNGRRATALVNVTPIRSDSGETESVVVTFQDTTPLRELERLRSEFLDMVSRELRAPLTSIKGSAATLLESLYTLDPAETVHLVRIIDSQANQMRALIRDLLDAARIETGTLSILPEPAEVAVLVSEAKNAFLNGGGPDDISMDIDPDLPLVKADRTRIVQVLTKLLSNAARFSDESSPTRVRAVREGFHVKVSVAEQGRGVRAQRLMDLFRKYSRVEGTEGGREVLGSGLHLAICKGIVEAHGGRVWAESEGPDKPNWLSFTLPMMEALGTGSRTLSDPSFTQARAGEQVGVLVVDDDLPTLRYVQDALTNAGFAVIAPGDPEQALEHIGVSKPNLVVLDLVLSSTDGVALLNAILGVTDVPVICLSEYGRDEINARALEIGAADYVVKPFAPTELVARIRAALRRHATPERREPPEPFVLADLVINYAERRVTVSGQVVQLTATEYNLLSEFSVNAGRVLSHDHLLRQVWGLWHNGGGGTIRTTVKRLRRKLGDDAADPKYIFTVPRVGYRMTKADTLAEAHH